MEIVKDVAVRPVVIHDGSPGFHDAETFPDQQCRSCPWGSMFEATLIVNGFPHKRILRFDPQRLHHDVTQWMEGLAI